MVPLDLTFERKWQPRTRVPSCIGTVLQSTAPDAGDLMRTFEEGLRTVILASPSLLDVARKRQIATAATEGARGTVAVAPTSE